jgi:GNAT superfamily N-acetyltransferase
VADELNTPTIQVNPDVPSPSEQPIQVNPDVPAYDPAKDKTPFWNKVNPKPTSPTIEAAPEPSVGAKIKKIFTENIPQFSSRTSANPEYGQMGFAAPEEIFTPEQQKQHPVATEALKFIGKLTHPSMPGVIAGSAGLGELFPAIAPLISGAFSLDMLHSAYQKVPEFKAAIDRAQNAKTQQEHDEAFGDSLRIGTDMALTGAGAAAAGMHAAGGVGEAFDASTRSGVPDEASTFKAPEPAAQAAAEKSGVEEPLPEMSRETAKALADLGYTNYAIEHFSGIGEIRDILKNKTAAPPEKNIPPVEKTPVAAPAADGSSTAVPSDHTTFDSVGGIEVKAPDLVSADKIAPTIKHEPIGDSAGLVKLMDGGKEVGRVRYTIPQEERPDTAAITAAHVEPTYRGQQHAQALYLRAADELRARGISKMTSDLQGTTTMDAARVWDALAAKGYPVTKIPSKPGSPGYTMDLTKPQAEPAPPEPQFEQALAGRGQLPGQTINMSEAYGDTGRYVSGLNQAPRPGSEDAEDNLVTNELQTPLKEPYSLEVRDPDGTTHTEPVEAFSPKTAIAAAKKQFPEAQEWSIKSFGERVPSDKYAVGTQQHLSMPASGDRSAVHTVRHELSHAMVGQNEGLVQKGMLRHTHPDSSSDMRASVVWDGRDIFQPGTQTIKPEKRSAVVRTLMGGIAADEVFNDLHRAANHNFNISSRGSDGGQAYQILRALGDTHEDALEFMHKQIDAGVEYLTQPAVSGMIKENEGTREAGLSRQYHYSPERLRNMHLETQRRIEHGDEQGVAERPDDRAVGGLAAGAGETDVAAGEGRVSQATGPATDEKITTADTRKVEPAYHPDLQKVVDEHGVSDLPAAYGASFIAPIPKKLKQTAADNMNDPDTRFNAARHEAAHSVISEMLTPGSVNSTGLTAGGGVTDIQPPAGKTTVGQLSPDEVRNMIATSYAGGLSEPGGTTPMHSSGDLAARKQVLGGRADTMWQGIQRLATGGTGGTDQMLQGGQQSAEAKARVTALLADPAVQKHIDNVTSHIAARGKLSGDEVREIMKPSTLTAAK